MKKLTKILGLAALGAGLFFTPVKKVSADDFSFCGNFGLGVNFDWSPVSVNYVPDSITKDTSSGGLASSGFTDLDLDLRLGGEYKPCSWFNFVVGSDVGVLLNGDSTGTFDEYSCSLSPTPTVSINLGAFARASFLDDLLFAEYSAGFLNEVSVITGYHDSSGNSKINESDKLGNFIKQKIIAGIHIPNPFEREDKWVQAAENTFPFRNTNNKPTTSLELYAGVDIPQIVGTTSLGKEMGLSAKPTFTLGSRIVYKF